MTELQGGPAIWRTRPGADAIRAAPDDEATEVAPGVWLSSGLSNTYLLTHDDGRIVVNTGMGFEAPTHRRNFDAVSTAPVSHVVLTQGHFDHVGGVDVMRDAASEIVMQADWATWRDDNERLGAFRVRNSAFAWYDAIAGALRPGAPPQAAPTPTLVVDDRLTLDIGGRVLELIATPGGETTDSLVGWLPAEGVCLAGNVFGCLIGHIPNLVTMRGDRYRDALTVIDSIETVRALGPEVLLTGHFAPVVGARLIQDELTRLRDAMRWLHDAVVDGMNAGTDVHTLMATLRPPYDVGEGYGKVAWDVRAIWETYAGWFHHASTTELYAVPARAVHADLVELAGADAVADRARTRLAAGEPVEAIHLAEVALGAEPEHTSARGVMLDAHRALLDASTNFWETAWLRKQISELS